MTQHFTKNTVEASLWCKVCAKETPHAVSDGHAGLCLRCISRLNTQHDLRGMEKVKEPEQMTLIERYGTVDIGESCRSGAGA